jgi:proline iminopeptidase
LRWFYQDGCSWIHPEAFAEFQRFIPADERGDMIAAYYRRLTSSDLAVRQQAARAWSIWEGTTLSLLPEADRVARFGADAYALAFARIESHYFVNGGFLRRDGELLQEAHRLDGIPGIIVHGRYDVVTPVKNAVALSEVWRDAELRIVSDAGHAMTEPGIVHELVRATRAFSTLA